jgi:ribosome recycling factor
MLNDIYEETEMKMEDSIEAMKRDFHTLRTGKVTTAVLDGVKVEYYGSLTPLNQVANITATDATTLRVSPFEKTILAEVEQAIQKANIGVNPNNDGDFIILNFPPMTSEQRQETVKQAKAKAEHAKVGIRNNRKSANDTIKKLEKDKEISEDESKSAQDQIQKITDKFIAKADEVLKEKEQDITTI